MIRTRGMVMTKARVMTMVVALRAKINNKDNGLLFT